MKKMGSIMRRVRNGWLTLPVILLMLMFSPNPSQATIINPLPGSYGADDGTELFNTCLCMAALEGYDRSDKGSATGSTFGFFYAGSDLNNPNNLITLFDPLDEIVYDVNGQVSSRPKASVDFVNGIVYDVDAGGTIQDTFTPLGSPIGFFFEADPSIYGYPLYTVAGLNPGGLDAAATFPHLTKDKTYLIGYEIPASNTTLAFEVIQGITPVPEPGTLYMIGSGLLLVAFLSRKVFSGSARRS